MSQENVEAVRELGALVGDDATELGDLTMIDPEVVYEDDLLPDHVGETYVGYRGPSEGMGWVRGAVDGLRG